jgi:hypothetical protein
MTFVQHHAWSLSNIAVVSKTTAWNTHPLVINMNNTRFGTNTLTLQYYSSISLSYVGLPDTKTHWISYYSCTHRNETETFCFLLSAPDKTRNKHILNTKDKNLFWKTAGVRLGLHAMYSTYENISSRFTMYRKMDYWTFKVILQYQQTILNFTCDTSHALHNLKALMSGISQIPGHSHA